MIHADQIAPRDPFYVWICFVLKKPHVILFLKSHLVLFLKCVAWLATIVSVIFIASHFCIPATRRCVTLSQS